MTSRPVRPGPTVTCAATGKPPGRRGVSAADHVPGHPAVARAEDLDLPPGLARPGKPVPVAREGRQRGKHMPKLSAAATVLRSRSTRAVLEIFDCEGNRSRRANDHRESRDAYCGQAASHSMPRPKLVSANISPGPHGHKGQTGTATRRYGKYVHFGQLRTHLRPDCGRPQPGQQLSARQRHQPCRRRAPRPAASEVPPAPRHRLPGQHRFNGTPSCNPHL